MVDVAGAGPPVAFGDLTVVASGVTIRPVSSRGGAAPATTALDTTLALVGLSTVASGVVELLPDRSGTRGGTAAPGVDGEVTVSVPPPPPGKAQVLLVQDGGALRWVVASPPKRGTAPGTTFTFRASAAPAGAEPARGILGAVVRKVLKVVAFELVDAAVGRITDRYVSQWEDKARPHRLRLFGPTDYTTAAVPALDAAAIDALAGAPALLLIHGTNSRSHTGFASFDPQVVRELHARYEGRVFALDHPTLSVDPKANARWLVDALPADAGLVVDVLAHSRGGLVARMLSERPAELGLDPKRLSVRQVVFVATPSAGTPLADPDALGAMVDGLTNLLDLVPDNPASPVIDALGGIVAVVKQLAVSAANRLDGLVAMRPAADDTTGFLAALNTTPTHATTYRAIAADYEPAPGSGLARVARDAAMDHIFGGEANDLIVPTASAYQWNGSAGFPIAERVVLPATRAVDHSSFWRASEVVAALTAWLAPSPTALVPSSLAGIDRTGAPATLRGGADPFADIEERLAAGDLVGVRRAVDALPPELRDALAAQVGGTLLDSFTRGKADAPKRGKVYVLPGIMGSLLSVRDGERDTDRIWMNPARLVLGEFSRLAHTGSERVVVDGLYRAYLPLVMGLDEHWDVTPLGYDWRLGLDDAAASVAERIDADGVPAHLVAHSMGGLVCRALSANHPATWDRLASRGVSTDGGRLVMLGTPTLGSLSIASALSGDDKMVRLLTWVDIPGRSSEIQSVIGGFPGVYQLLPPPRGDADLERLYDAKAWGKRSIATALLDRARAMHEVLDGSGLDTARMSYIAGTGHATPFRFRITNGRFEYQTTPAGDGRVTHESGLARDARGNGGLRNVWYASTDHGGLVKHRGVIAAVDDILTTGTTTRLPTEVVAGGARGDDTGQPWVTGDQLEADTTLDTRGADWRGAGRARRTEIAQRAVEEATSSWLGAAPTTVASPPALTLRVRHTSFEHAHHVVVLGHYAGTPLGGAEAYADRLLGGRLTTRQVLGLYPADPGDCLRVIPSASSHSPLKGIVVVGLGEMGDLTPSSLARAVRSAVLDHALSEVQPGDPQTSSTIGISMVPIGSYGPDGLLLPTVVASLVEGVVLANRDLAQLRTRQVRVGEIEIVELFAQRAEEVTRIACDIDQHLPASILADANVHPPTELEIGEGGRPGSPSASYGEGMWRRLLVSGPDTPDATDSTDSHASSTPLTFTSLGGRARADLLPHRIDDALIGSMIEGAVASARTDDDVNVALFELLLPNDLKRDLVSVQNLVLVVDDTTADIPWEALADRTALGGPQALVHRMGLVRQLKIADRRVVEAVPAERHALVIGNPPAGSLPPLAGAQREATEVAGVLRSAGVHVRDLVYGLDASTAGVEAAVVGALLGADYQIVHIAGHGWFEPGDGHGHGAARGGVVVGDGRYLTAQEIGQMRHAPGLVFLNCCHLGTVGTVLRERDGDAIAAPARTLAPAHRPRLAASLSRKLMEMGVRAVVAAGWSVDDRAAAEFARELYEQLLDGEPFGVAVKRARWAAYLVDGGSSNTWAAYQCYGDPGFRLGRPRPAASARQRFVSAEDLVETIERRAVEAGDPGANAEWLREQLDDLRAEGEQRWRDSGRIWSALGHAYGECLDLEHAIECYRTALACHDAALPVKAIEQLANIEVREASALLYQLMRAPDATKLPLAEALLASAEKHTRALSAFPTTPERLSIVGGYWKLRASAPGTTAGERRTALKSAAKGYAQRWRSERKSYGLLIALQLDGLHTGVLTQKVRTELLAALDELDATSRPENFWGRIEAADLAVTRAIRASRRTAALDLTAMEAMYIATFKDRSTARERHSPIRHLRELALIAPDGPLTDALAQLAERLSAWRPA